jgi:hypothetical protein
MTSTADDTPERQQKVTRRELAEAILIQRENPAVHGGSESRTLR